MGFTLSLSLCLSSEERARPHEDEDEKQRLGLYGEHKRDDDEETGKKVERN